MGSLDQLVALCKGPTRKDFEDVLFVLYKMFPQGICAGGYPRDILTGCQPKDIDFWLPKGFDASQVQVFADAVKGTVVSTYDAVQYGMAFDEDRIAAIYQVQCGNGVQVDLIETLFPHADVVLSTFTDNYSSCVVVPDWFSDTTWIYTWAYRLPLITKRRDAPTDLVFNDELLEKCCPLRRSQRIEKIQAKWDAWVQKGRPVCA